MLRHRATYSEQADPAGLERRTLRIGSELLEATERTVCVLGGRGSGKTEALSDKILQLMCANAGMPGLIVAPTATMLVNVTLPPFLRKLRQAGVPHKINKQERRIEIAGDPEWAIYLGTTERPETIEGYTVAWVAGDEARYYSEEAHRVLIARRRLRSSKLLQLVYATTPTAGGWLQDTFDGSRKNCTTIRGSTRENPFNARGYLEDLLATYSPEQVRAYVDGEFVVLEGLVYPEYSEASHVIEYEANKSIPVVAGLDFGARYPAIIYAQITEKDQVLDGKSVPRGSIVAFDEDVPDNMYDTPALANRIADRYPPGGELALEWVACDPAGAMMAAVGIEQAGYYDVQLLKNALADRGMFPRLRYVWGRGTAMLRSIAAGIEYVRGRLKNALGISRLFFARRLQLTRSTRGVLKAIRSYAYRPGLQIPMRGEPANQADHILDALRYLVRHIDLVGVGGGAGEACA